MSDFEAFLFKGENGQQVLAIKGTELNDWGDLETNWDQAFGNIGAQYRDLAELSDDLEDEDFSIAGHSLGGGLGSVLGTLTERTTYTFNATGIHTATMDQYSISATAANSHVAAYSVRGDFLTSVQLASPFPDAIGNPTVLDPDISLLDSLSYLVAAAAGGPVGHAAVSGADLHTIGESIESINMALKDNDCN